MNKNLLNKLQKMELRKRVSDIVSINFISQMPKDYINFMSFYDGGAGFVGDSDNYLDLWTNDNINKLNPYFSEDEFSNQVIIIGSNGSGMLYGYDLLNKKFFVTDEFQMNRSEIINIGNTFFEFIEFVEAREY